MTVHVDGSQGEGGGQVLRTSLSLAAITGKDLHIVNIRAKRSQPGLRPQHLEAVRATAVICDAAVEGDRLGSQEVRFRPQGITGGRYQFTIPTAGSACLVLQTVLIPLAMAERTSHITIQGGTHVRWSPCFHYLNWQWLPFLKQMGYEAELALPKAGYYPQGGGEIQAVIQPGIGELPLQLDQRGELSHIRGLAAVTHLPDHIPRRMRQRVVSRLGSRFPLRDLRAKEIPGHDKGAFICLLLGYSASRACFFSLGERGKRAEVVADEVVDQALEFLSSEGCVDQFIGDQLLLPLSFAEGRSMFRLPEITSHLVTNANIIQHFLSVDFEIHGEIGQSGTVTVLP